MCVEMTTDLFLSTRIHYDPETDAFAMDHHWQNMADAARQAGHPAYISAPDDLMLKLQRQQSLTYGNIADHLPLHHPYPPQIQSYYRHNAGPEHVSSGYTPLSPPHSTYVPSLGSSGCGTNSRHTSPSVSETSSSRTGSWPTNPIDQQAAGGGFLGLHIAQHPQAVGYLPSSYGYHHAAHDYIHTPTTHTVITMNQVQLSQDEFQLAQGDVSEYDTSTVGATGISNLQRGSSDDADGSTVDADSTEMDLDQDPVSDNDETMSEPASDRDAEGEDDEDQDYDPSGHSRKRLRTSRSRVHRRTTSNSSNASQGAGPAGSKSKGKGKKRNPPSQVRAFPCPLAVYGCKESFDSKNEWKRHINTQHVPIAIFRCKFCCPPSKSRAGPYKSQRYDFVRKDLFTMHLKRMHAVECNIDPLPMASGSGRRRQKDSTETIKILSEISKQCETRIRDPPEQVECILCHHTFNGPKCWEERTEHIATGHFEAARKQNIAAPGPEEWHHDAYLEEWLIRENIIKRGRDGSWQFT